MMGHRRCSEERHVCPSMPRMEGVKTRWDTGDALASKERCLCSSMARMEMVAAIWDFPGNATCLTSASFGLYPVAFCRLQDYSRLNTERN